jgi:hypothetical protein
MGIVMKLHIFLNTCEPWILCHPCDLKNIFENSNDMFKTRNGQNKNSLKYFSIFEIGKLTSFFLFTIKKSKAKRY